MNDEDLKFIVGCDDMANRLDLYPKVGMGAAICRLVRLVREQDKRARHAEQERDAFDKRIAELETEATTLKKKLRRLVDDWDEVAGDTYLFSPGYREAVTICSDSIKELIGADEKDKP